MSADRGTPRTRTNPQCLDGSFESPGCAATRMKAQIADLERELTALRAARGACSLGAEEINETARECFSHYGMSNARDLKIRSAIEQMRDQALAALSAPVDFLDQIVPLAGRKESKEGKHG